MVSTELVIYFITVLSCACLTFLWGTIAVILNWRSTSKDSHKIAYFTFQLEFLVTRTGPRVLLFLPAVIIAMIWMTTGWCKEIQVFMVEKYTPFCACCFLFYDFIATFFMKPARLDKKEESDRFGMYGRLLGI